MQNLMCNYQKKLLKKGGLVTKIASKCRSWTFEVFEQLK